MFSHAHAFRLRCFSAPSGIVVALVAVCLIVMLGMLSLALDVGWMMNTKDQLQNAADSAALAAAMELGQPNSETVARNTAKTYANLHRAGEQYADVDPASPNITLGMSTLNPVNQTWSYRSYPSGTPGLDSVSVTLRRSTQETAPNRGPLPLFFAGVLGRTQSNISATSVAQLTARDIAVALDVSGSMVFDSSFVRFDTHMSDGGSGLVPGITVNNADLYYAYSGPADTNHIQTRMEATGTMFAGTPVGANGYSVYMPPQDGNVSSAYSSFAQNNQGMKLGIIGTATLPYGNGTVAGVYDPQTDPGLVFIPMGTFSFDSKSNQTGVPANSQMSSNTANTGLHATSGDDSTSAPGNLWGITVAANVNPAWPTVENDLRTRRGYSVEEVYCLRNPQDPNYTTLAPRNPQFTHPTGANVAAASTAQEGTTASRWQLRSMVILDMAKWDSSLLNPLWVLPPNTPPASTALLSTAGGAFTNATWLAEAQAGNLAVRISRAAGGITSTMDLPQGKRYVAGNQPEWAFYEISGVDGFRNARQDWSTVTGGSQDDNTAASTFQFKTPATLGCNTTDLPGFPGTLNKGWVGADGIPYTGDDVIFGIAYYDANNSGSYQAGERLAKAWSLAKLGSSSNPSAPNTATAQWRWLSPPHYFRDDPLYQYHFWEKDSSMTLASTATGDNKCWDAGEVRWPGTGASLDGRSGTGFITGSYSGSGTPGKLSEEIILADMNTSTTLQTYFNWVAGPRNTAYWSYPGRSRLLQWRFGAKTLTETNLIIQRNILQSQYQFQLPMLPFQAGRDAIFAFTQYENTMAQNQDYYAKDFLAMAIFGQDSATNALVVPLTYTYDHLWSKDYLSPNNLSTQQNGQNASNTNVIPSMCLQPVMWSGATNIGGGLRRAYEAIDKSYSANNLRQNSKTTVLLITDGRTNIWYQRSDLTNPTSPSSYNTSNATGVGGRQSLQTVNGVENYDGPSWTIDANGNLIQNPAASTPTNWNTYNSWFTTAMQNNPYGVAISSGSANAADLLTRQEVWYLAKQRNVTFHVVLIGADADPFLGNWIASVSGGICIWANGSPAQYIPILQAAFRTLAAFKPVSLVL